MLTMLLKLVTRTRRINRLLSAANLAPLGDERLARSLTDVLPRSLFGRSEVNSQSRSRCAATPTRSSPGRPTRPMPGCPPDCTLRRTARSSDSSSAQTMFVTSGYHRTRISGITAEAGLSQGTFYHYFRDKDHVTEVLALRALRRLAGASSKSRRWMRTVSSTRHSCAAGSVTTAARTPTSRRYPGVAGRHRPRTRAPGRICHRSRMGRVPNGPVPRTARSATLMRTPFYSSCCSRSSERNCRARGCSWPWRWSSSGDWWGGPRELSTPAIVSGFGSRNPDRAAQAGGAEPR